MRLSYTHCTRHRDQGTVYQEHCSVELVDGMRKTLIFIVILSLIVVAMFALVLVVPILHIG
jgi:hypothetical protein